MKYKQHESTELEWRIEAGKFYLRWKGELYRIVNLRVFANGTRDLCIVEHKDGNIGISLIEGCKEKILNIPQNDIAIFSFSVEVPDLGRHMIIEVDDELAPLIAECIKRFPGEKRKDYDAYLGREYVKVYE